jgi:hypothetical protein
MVSEVAQAGVVVGVALALRYALQLVVVVWSLRADEHGREHAIRVLQLLRGGQRRGKEPP